MKLRIGIPTKGHDGMEDMVSEVFGKAKTFTIVDVENGKIRKVKVIDNPAASYEYGSGPIVAKTFVDLKVDAVISGRLGPGASKLLEHHGIKQISVSPAKKVANVIEDVRTEIESKQS